MLGFVKKCLCNSSLFNALLKKERSSNIEDAKKYLKKYLKDLALHFSLSDEDVEYLISQVHCSYKQQNPLIKYLSMIRYWNRF